MTHNKSTTTLDDNHKNRTRYAHKRVISYSYRTATN